MKKEIGDYNNELTPLYNRLEIYHGNSEFYFKFFKVSESEFVLNGTEKFPLLEEKYNFSELKEILEVTPKSKLKKINNLAKIINSELDKKERRVSFFKEKLSELYETINDKPLDF
jgi:hypothetical protein